MLASTLRELLKYGASSCRSSALFGGVMAKKVT